MQLWRISNFANLSGDGGLHASGRWHSRGTRIVYLADHPASALLETMVHLEIDPIDIPNAYQLVSVDVPDDIQPFRVETIDLPSDWRQQLTVTRGLGDTWLASGLSALLQVPSAIAPSITNFLLNPTHADTTRIRITGVVRAPFDPRLIRLLIP